jgi:hypothetical protein
MIGKYGRSPAKRSTGSRTLRSKAMTKGLSDEALADIQRRALNGIALVAEKALVKAP